MYQHKSTSLADQIFERLENDILIGRYQIGEVLTESKLSEQLGVSRTPIREALRRLQQEIMRMDSTITKLTGNKDSLEQFARENFHFAVPGEDVYLIDEN